MKTILLVLLLFVCTACDRKTESAVKIQKVIGFTSESYEKIENKSGSIIGLDGSMSIVNMPKTTKQMTRDVFAVYLADGRLLKIPTRQANFHFNEGFSFSYVVIKKSNYDEKYNEYVVFIKGDVDDYIK